MVERGASFPSSVSAIERRCYWSEALLLASAFAIAHTQSPLFYSNQNQYLLHGLAAARVGQLHEDWLANTRDPTPVFSYLVTQLWQLLGPLSVHGAYWVLLVLYFCSFWYLGVVWCPRFERCSVRWMFAALVMAAHAAGPRLLSVQLTGTDYPWYVQCGLANQYLLGPGLQPSAFGVLLVSGLAAFAAGRPIIAGACIGLTCLFHITYLLPALVLLGGYATILLRHNQPHAHRQAFALLLTAFLFITPAATYTLFTFGSANPHTWSEAQRILVEVRIPHHAVIARWFAWPDACQLLWIAAGLWLVRHTAWGQALACAAAAGLLLSLVQYFSGSHALALLFPWRISAVLVPTATAIIAGLLAGHLAQYRLALPLAGVMVVLLVATGIATMLYGWGYQSSPEEQGLMEYVRQHVQSGDVYLLPVRFPPVGQGRGTRSTTFTPPPRPRPDSPLIPVDWQRFRLVCGAPIYVDFKAIPYYDVEVLEWYRRMRQCELWYAGGWDSLQRREELRAEGITHVVAPAAQAIVASYLRLIYEDAAYRLYRVE